MSEGSTRAAWREHLHEVIFEADTRTGKAFDVFLFGAILLSVLAVMLESVASIDAEYHFELVAAEWLFTGLFTLEYVLRLLCVDRPGRYVRSFFGIVDLLSILPTYLALLGLGAQSFLVLRTLRLLRVFRVLKLAQFLSEARVLTTALHASRHKITVFLGAVLCVVVIMGAVMHLVEGPQNGFTSIPKSMYWAVVTMTTVGYGDVTPQTPFGQAISALLMVLGYGIIAVPTGIVSAELVRVPALHPVSTQACKSCAREGHDPDASHCKWCGAEL